MVDVNRYHFPYNRSTTPPPPEAGPREHQEGRAGFFLTPATCLLTPASVDQDFRRRPNMRDRSEALRMICQTVSTTTSWGNWRRGMGVVYEAEDTRSAATSL